MNCKFCNLERICNLNHLNLVDYNLEDSFIDLIT